MKTTILAALCAMAPMTALAENPVLTVSEAYARSSNPKSGAAFMALHNGTDHDCTLVEARSDIAEKIELHTHVDMGDGVMKMGEAEGGFTVPAGHTHLLARGGDHVMFLGLKQPLQNGDDIPLTLDFADCGAVQMMVRVDNDHKGPEVMPHKGSDAPAHHNMPGMEKPAN